MLKKIPFAVAVLLSFAVFVSCGANTARNDTKALTETTLEASIVTETTLSETTAAVTTQVSTVPESTSEKVTTTKKASTTKKAKIKQTSASISERAEETKKETETVRESKYGVKVVKNITLIYEVFSDGSERKAGETVSTVSCNRIGYSASYDDLLPAAKENRKKYAEFINEILRITNSYRAEKGVAPLKLSEELTVMSCVRAEELAWSGDHDHYRPGGKYFSSIFKEAGYSEGKVGENLGWGFETPQAVCEAWRASETHYKNMMNPEFTVVGLGVAKDADPEHKYCWTQHFYASESEE